MAYSALSIDFCDTGSSCKLEDSEPQQALLPMFYSFGFFFFFPYTIAVVSFVGKAVPTSSAATGTAQTQVQDLTAYKNFLPV